MNIKRKAISGIKWTAFSTFTVSTIQFLQLIILARALDPFDIGVLAILMVIVGFILTFLDVGLNNAIVQKGCSEILQLSTIFWLSILIGFVISAVIYISSQYLETLFGKAPLGDAIRLIAPVFFINSCGSIYRSLYQRNLNFIVPAFIESVSVLCGFIVTVYLILSDYGLMSAVIGYITTSILSNSTFILAGRNVYFKPQYIFSINSISKYLNFGGYDAGNKAINYLSANVDKILIGKFSGMQSVGFYNLAWQFVAFPSSKLNLIIDRIAFPFYSHAKDDSEELQSSYTKTVQSLTTITIPILTFLAFYSDSIVYVTYGSQWHFTARIIEVLAYVGILKAIGNPGGSIMLALGRADICFWWNIVWFIVVVTFLSIALSISPSIMTTPYMLLFLILTIGSIWHIIISRTANINYSNIIWHVTSVFIISHLAGFVSYILIEKLSGANIFTQLFTALLLFSAIVVFLFALTIWILKKYRNNWNTVIK